MPFSYPALPAGDGLRILTLNPGEFWADLSGTLTAVPFSTKPSYLALSYTWADPDQEHAAIPAMPKSPPSTAPPEPTLTSDTTLEPGSSEEDGDSDGASAAEAEGEQSAADAPQATPHIILNDEVVPLFHNVSLALRFLRSETHSLALWVDAVCIDQSSVLERNAQVALMAFIFTRAAAVISWLGVPSTSELAMCTHSSSEADGYHLLMSRAWREGHSRHVAKRLAERRGRSAAGKSLFGFQANVSGKTFEKTRPVLSRAPGERLLENSYWQRLWVIQEVCLPRELYFVYGSEVLTEAVVRQMKRSQLMDRLLGARSNRFSDAMRLEALIERFMGSGCAEVRDRVFGLVGLANDVDSFALETQEPSPGQPGEPGHGLHGLDRARTSSSSLSLIRQSKTKSPSRRGRPLPSIAYASDSESSVEFEYDDDDDDDDAPSSKGRLSKPSSNTTGARTGFGSFFGAVSAKPPSPMKTFRAITATDVLLGDKELPRDLTESQSSLPKSKRGRGMLEISYRRGFYDIWTDVIRFMHFRAKPLLDFGKADDEMEDERRVRVVRFAGVVQRAFEGKVEEELRTTEAKKRDDRKASMIVAKGYIAGKIVHLGPRYSDFVGSYRDQQRWVGSWDSHYHTASDLEKLRQMEEVYSSKIIDYHDIDLARIRPIFSPQTRAWSVLQTQASSPSSLRLTNRRGYDRPSPAGTDYVLELNPPRPASAEHDPMRFLGTEFCMGLAPTAARVDDLVIRFWNCDAAIVVRKCKDAGRFGDDVQYELVGRADVAEPYARENGMDNQAKDAMKVFEVREPARADLARERIPVTKRTRAMYVAMDYDTLQKISAAIEI